MPDQFSDYYQDLLDGTYDCVDRIVLNAYFYFAQSGGGFRTWWRLLRGGDKDLNNTNLMRFAGRFSRRVRAYAKKQGIPVIDCQRGERKSEIAKEYLPTEDPLFQGVFCILAGRAPAPVRDIQRYGNGGINITRKRPQPYVNHYSFHIMDREWGHIIIKLCPHPPFNAQIILNGHEYVARRATELGIPFAKEGNCFTGVSNAAGLAGVADTMRAPSSVGRLVQVCERWIYSACLYFAMDLAEQKRTRFVYSYSVYQVEYSRNLLFTRGRTMEEILNKVIDRTRAALDIRTVKTIFGAKRRPYKRGAHGTYPRLEIVVERPVYNLTVFKVHFGKLTVKVYSKGERVLRIEVVAHNTADLPCGKRIERFPEITSLLKAILERFLSVLRCVDVSFIDSERLDAWPRPSKVGAVRVGGVDINSPRIRAVMEAVIALSLNPRGFTVSDVAEKVRELLKGSHTEYRPRQASYDLKKFRGKGVIYKIPHSRCYEVTPDGLRAMTALLVLRDKVLIPLLSKAGKRGCGPKPLNRCKADIHYDNIQTEMQGIFKAIGIAA